jgi:hypothetical protein
MFDLSLAFIFVVLRRKLTFKNGDLAYLPGGPGSYRESDASILYMVWMPASQASSFSQPKPHILHRVQTSLVLRSWIINFLFGFDGHFIVDFAGCRRLFYQNKGSRGKGEVNLFEFGGGGLCSKHMHDALPKTLLAIWFFLFDADFSITIVGEVNEISSQRSSLMACP